MTAFIPRLSTALPERVHTVRVHPIVFLEPAVHLILGAVLLAWSPFPSVEVGVLVGSAFVVGGFVWGLLALLKYRAGALSLHAHELVFPPKLAGGGVHRVQRQEVDHVTTRRGARRLRFDPVHAALNSFVRYGSVEVYLEDGSQHVIHPVHPERAATVIRDWASGVRESAPQHQGATVLPGLTALVFVVFAVSILAGAGATHTASLPMLLVGATVLELAFWLSLLNARSSRPRSPRRTLPTRR